MKKKEIDGYTVLEADKGMVLLKGGEFVCGTMAWLSNKDHAGNYSEITEGEAGEIERRSAIGNEESTAMP